ncbi:glycoside hydrolase family 127 protein [Streptomyces sp. PSKA54]|uniref:Glycoside hydrolase family 127 protein n=1 Tax=Streptomyces himalayensis subsp. aureolus TaxID=2758039 RepID=A0A7W2HF45_9ACTN|nr:beta-L-arabinofuranosidase domain-containing protein [Streptomyces himalayensis]MBA4861598.1 glycoside hydrolase family 127 protein [Streptomyces himalayensis subsp. aureolus]
MSTVTGTTTGAGPVRLTGTAHTTLHPATEARITGGFWAARRRTNAEVSIPQGPAKLEEAGNLANLRAAADGKGTFTGDFQFQDSDVHKWLEAASWQLADNPSDTQLTANVEELTSLLAAAQEADGYLQTFYQVKHPELRWRELDWGHELYCAGHLVQAAVAHHRATGRQELLDVAVRFAALIDSVFGPDKEIDGIDGHPEIETALVELYRETGERRWLDLASYFVDRRGHGLLNSGVDRGHDRDPGQPYWQDHVPVREARTVAGHAVRQLYLLAGATDLAAETGDPELRAAMEQLWQAMVETKTYLTGGVGSRHEGEAFGDPYELPPDRAYAETCAAIASVQWSWRMALLTGEAKYSDLVERTLFNGFLSGVALDGDRWLYVNPLQVREDYDARPGDQAARRTPWFRCACCPPNVMRLLASLPHYVASGDAEGAQLHQYATGVYAAGGGTVRVETDYPWNGRISVTVEEAPADRDWTLSLRLPSWCTEFAVMLPDGAAPAESGDGWVRVRHRWSAGDTVVLDLAMAPRITHPDPRTDAVRGCVAIERGPLVHCLEGVDQEAGVRLDDVTLSPAASLTADARPDLLGGVTVVTAEGRRRSDGSSVRLTAVPYHAWANRDEGAMRVWIPTS